MANVVGDSNANHCRSFYIAEQRKRNYLYILCQIHSILRSFFLLIVLFVIFFVKNFSNFMMISWNIKYVAYNQKM